MIIFVLSFLFILYILTRQKNVKVNLDKKIALVTGGANGLGQQICYHLAQKGCHVIIADVSSCDETLKKLETFDVRSKAYKVDVSNADEILKLKDKVAVEFGDIDILVNNAGLIPYKTLFDQSYGEIQKLIDVNVNGVIFMTKCFLENMVKRGRGHIVSISSTQGIYAFPYSITYSSSKYAVTGFMLAIKEYLRREKLNNIITTTIHPNVIATRDDILSIVNSSQTTILSPNKCAEVIVDAIEKCKPFITIPSHMGLIISLFNVMPFWLQHIIRDLRDEASFLKKSS